MFDRLLEDYCVPDEQRLSCLRSQRLRTCGTMQPAMELVGLMSSLYRVYISFRHLCDQSMAETLNQQLNAWLGDIPRRICPLTW
jgi:hypothetical protein